MTRTNRQIGFLAALVLLFASAVLAGCGTPVTVVAPAAISPTPSELAASAPTPSKPANTAAPTSTPSIRSTAVDTPTVPAASDMVEQVEPTSIPVEPVVSSMQAQVAPGDLNNILGMALVGDTLWAITSGGLVSWDLITGLPTRYDLPLKLFDSPLSSAIHCPLPEGNWLYIGHEDGQLSRLDLDTRQWDLVKTGPKEEEPASKIQSLTCDLSGSRLFLGGTEFLNILDFTTGEWSYIGPQQGLTAQSILGMHVSGPAVWIAAGEQGGYLVNGHRAVAFRYLDGFPGGKIMDLATDLGGAWIVYMDGLVFFRLQDYSLTPYGSMIPFRSIDLLEIAPDGILWVANAVEGVCPFEPNQRFCDTIYQPPDGSSITVLITGTQGSAYAGTDGGGIVVLLPDGVRRLVFETPNPN